LGDHIIVEYQVYQTLRGADIVVRINGPIDALSLARSLEHDLEVAGLRQPAITIKSVDSFDRQTTGKFKRFFRME
jgi:hypothetical protein